MLRDYLLGLLSAVLMIPGVLLGLVCHRFRDGWVLARFWLDKIDDSAGLFLRRKQPPETGKPCRADGRCQYAIDHGAEGLGACLPGKCVMAQGEQG